MRGPLKKLCAFRFSDLTLQRLEEIRFLRSRKGFFPGMNGITTTVDTLRQLIDDEYARITAPKVDEPKKEAKRKRSTTKKPVKRKAKQ